MSRKEELKKLKEFLIRENQRILRELQERQEKYNGMDKEIHKCFPQTPEEDQLPSRLKDFKNDRKCLKLSSLTVGIDFNQMVHFVMDNNMHVYRGLGRTDFFTFDFQLKIKKPLQVCEVTLNFENKQLLEELGPWRRRYSRKRDFQALMRGISKYSELLSRMRGLLLSYKDHLNLHFEVTVSAVGCVTKAKRIHNRFKVPILTIHWKVAWKQSIGAMADCFTFEIPDADLFSENDLQLWREYVQKVAFSYKDIGNLWISILDSINIE